MYTDSNRRICTQNENKKNKKVGYVERKTMRIGVNHVNTQSACAGLLSRSEGFAQSYSLKAATGTSVGAVLRFSHVFLRKLTINEYFSDTSLSNIV